MRVERDPRSARGFTLTELAVVFAIVALLLAAGMFTLSAQTEVRNFEETRRRLELAKDLVLGFALVNGRLPCPATSASSGDEAPLGGGTCTNAYGGFLPARSIGFQITDRFGFAIDAWGNRIRYAVSAAIPASSQTPRVCRPVDDTTQPVAPHFTDKDTMRFQGLDCKPSDLVICQSATGITGTNCGTATPVTNQTTLVALLLSTGKNGGKNDTFISAGDDEAANDGVDPVFVWHTPTPAGATNGEFDDQMTWITVGELYAKLIAAGILP